MKLTLIVGIIGMILLIQGVSAQTYAHNLVEVSDQCLGYCELTIELKPDIQVSLTNFDDLTAQFVGKGSSYITDYGYKVLVNNTKDIKVQVYKTKTNQLSYFESNGQFNATHYWLKLTQLTPSFELIYCEWLDTKDKLCLWNTTETTYEDDTIVVEEWEDFDPANKHIVLKTNKFTKIKLWAKRNVADYKNLDVDAIPYVKGFGFPEYAWWNASWKSKNKMTITNDDGATMPAGTTIKIVLNTSRQYMQEDGDDFRIVYNDLTEIDRIAVNSWNESNTTIYFKTQADITAGSSDDLYSVYYNNSLATAPTINTSLIFNITFDFDDYATSSLDGQDGWSCSGAPGSWTVDDSVYKIGSKSAKFTGLSALDNNCARTFDPIDNASVVFFTYGVGSHENGVLETYLSSTRITYLNHDRNVVRLINDSVEHTIGTFTDSAWYFNEIHHFLNYNYSYHQNFTENIYVPTSVSQNAFENNATIDQVTIGSSAVAGQDATDLSYVDMIGIYRNFDYSVNIDQVTVVPTIDAISVCYTESAESTMVLNYSFWDERNRTSSWGSDFKGTFFLTGVDQDTNYSFYEYNQTWVGFCINSSAINATSNALEFEYTGWSRRHYFNRNTKLFNTTLTEIPLYMLPDGNYTQILITVEDISGIEQEGVYIEALRYFLEDNTYVTVDMAQTDHRGIGSLNLKLNEHYRYLVYDVNGTLMRVIGPEYLIATELEFIIDETAAEFLTYWNDLSIDCEFSTTTKYLSCTYSDGSGLLEEITLDVDRKLLLGWNESYCEHTLTTLSGTLLCEIPDYANTTFMYYVTAEFSGPDTTYITLIQDTLTYYDKIWDLGSTGIFITMLIIIALALVGIWHPAACIGFSLVGLFMAVIMQLVYLEVSALVGLAVAGAIIIYKARS